MAVRRLYRIVSRIMADRCRRRKAKVNYRILEEDNSDDDFTPSVKKLKPDKAKRLSRDEKKFQKELQNALSVSTKGPLDTSLVIGNRHAHLEENDDVINGHAHSGGSANEDTVETSYEPDASSLQSCESYEDVEKDLKKPLLLQTSKPKPDKKGNPVMLNNTDASENIPPTTQTTPTSLTGSERDLTALEPLKIVPVKQTKRLYWTPPGRISPVTTTGKSSLTSSSYQPANHSFTGSSTSTLRIGLSRHTKTKALHENVKLLPN